MVSVFFPGVGWAMPTKWLREFTTKVGTGHPTKLYAKRDYIHKNPITRGFVQWGEPWVWSSYRYYEYDVDSVIAMDWDGSWPIV